MARVKLLLTTFEPFGGESVNPAQLAGALVRPKRVELVRADIPVSYDKAGRTAIAAVKREKPDMILCVGQAAGRTGLSFERVALNVDDAAASDNDGVVKCDAVIEPMGENAYFSTLSVKAMARGATEAGVTASVSNSAGTYVCNHLLYELLHHEKGILCGFVHVPLTKEQAENRLSSGKAKALEPYMSPEEAARGIGAAIDAAVTELGL